MSEADSWLFLTVLVVLALLALASALFSAWQAARLSAEVSVSADLRRRLTALEQVTDKTLEVQRRLAVRLNLAEGKAGAKRLPSNGAEDDCPDMVADPDGYARWWERRLGIGLGKPPQRGNF